MGLLLGAANVLELYGGTSKTLRVRVQDALGAVYDLAGSELVFTVKRACKGNTVLLQKRTSVVGEGAIVSAVDGVAEIYLRPADTEGWWQGEYLFDMWLLRGSDRYVLIGPTAMQVKSTVGVAL